MTNAIFNNINVLKLNSLKHLLYQYNDETTEELSNMNISYCVNETEMIKYIKQ